MKRNILLATSGVLLLATSMAYGATGLYVNGNFGFAVPNDSDVTDSAYPEDPSVKIKSDAGIALGAAVGYNFGTFRFEGELAYQGNDFDKKIFADTDETYMNRISGDTSSTAWLINGYYDFVNKSAFTPFISAGLGMATIDLSITLPAEDNKRFSGDDTVFAWQVGAGVGYAINEKLTIDLKYRYFRTADVEIDTLTVPYSSNNIYVGMRYTF